MSTQTSTRRSVPAAPRPAPSPRAVWAALGVVYVVWGSTYLAIRYAVETIPPFLGAGARFLVAGVLMLAFLGLRRGWAALRIGPRQFLATALVGILLLVTGNGGVVYAETLIESHLAALVVAAVPLFVVVLRLLARDRPPGATVVGVLIGFAGLAVLVQPHGRTGRGVLVVLGAALCWSIGSFYSSRLPLPGDALVSTAYEMVAAGVVLLVLAGARGEHVRVSDVSTASWVGLAYLIVFGSLLAFTCYVWLLSSAPISTVATYAYVNPTVAVLLGAMTGESLTGRSLLGGLIVIAAVCVVVTTESRARRRAHHGEHEVNDRDREARHL